MLYDRTVQGAKFRRIEKFGKRLRDLSAARLEAVFEPSHHLAPALDEIPLTGEVDEHHFLAFSAQARDFSEESSPTKCAPRQICSPTSGRITSCRRTSCRAPIRESRFAEIYGTETVYSRTVTTVRSLRLKAGLSQAELSRRCGLRQATLSAIESGRSRPHRATVVALATALGVGAEELALAIRHASTRTIPIGELKTGAVIGSDWPFLAGLDGDLRAGLATSLVTEWTHSSTAIEGNTISAGDTLFVLTQGLTVSGKTLREHQELHGHAQAIHLMAGWTRGRQSIGITQLHELHRAVQTGAVVDSLAPVGSWKVEPNGATALTTKGTSKWHDYAAPGDVPSLVGSWLDLLADCCRTPVVRSRRRPVSEPGIDRATLAGLAEAYTDAHLGFTAIHPYADGNGRMARLLANVPLLRAGQPPLLIPSSRRRAYLTLMGDYSVRRGRPRPGQALVRPSRERSALVRFFVGQWEASLKVVREYQERQRARIAEVD